MKDSNTIEQAADEIIGLYKSYGNKDYIGEPVSQIEHMCQCAELAEESDADDETILAAFFHDVGHLCEVDSPANTVQHMDGFGIVDHEKLGGEYLRSKGFSKNIVNMVASHVNAKRYLTYKYPEYYDALSVASKNTLVHQGGRMSADEALLFEADPLSEKYIALRRWDEQAKEQYKPLPSLDYYRKLIVTHLSKQLQ
ncbi:MAG: HD domain-containing protein [Ferruginibacter sp.]|nr:HD domain-containing protein [Ferruginibacter sp.]